MSSSRGHTKYAVWNKVDQPCLTDILVLNEEISAIRRRSSTLFIGLGPDCRSSPLWMKGWKEKNCWVTGVPPTVKGTTVIYENWCIVKFRVACTGWRCITHVCAGLTQRASLFDTPAMRRYSSRVSRHYVSFFCLFLLPLREHPSCKDYVMVQCWAIGHRKEWRS